MKMLLTVAAAMIAAVCLSSGCASAAEPMPAFVQVGTTGLDLSTEEGIDKLALRFQFKMKSICGRAHVYALNEVNGRGGKSERKACKAELRVDPAASEPVKRAFAIALANFR